MDSAGWPESPTPLIATIYDQFGYASVVYVTAAMALNGGVLALLGERTSGRGLEQVEGWFQPGTGCLASI